MLTFIFIFLSKIACGIDEINAYFLQAKYVGHLGGLLSKNLLLKVVIVELHSLSSQLCLLLD